MTDKQRRFTDEYIIDCNATRAYKAAYPRIKSDDAPRANASRLLTNANPNTVLEFLGSKVYNNGVSCIKIYAKMIQR